MCIRCSEQADTVRAFLAATAKGYQFAAQHPEEAAELMCKTVTEEKLDAEVVKESMQMLGQVPSGQHVLHAVLCFVLFYFASFVQSV